METPPIVPEPEQPRRNNTTLIIIIAVVAVLCCCCLVAIPVLRWLWYNGDSFFNLGLILKSLL